MQNAASDLLLLVTNLSQLKSISRVKSIFTESLAEIFESSNVKWLEKSEANAPEIIPVCTRSKTYGYIEISKSILAQNTNLLPHIQNSVQLLAIILERIEQENALKKYQKKLEDLIHDQTRSLIKKHKELIAINEELAAANEELSVSNKSLIDINKNLYKEIEMRELAEKERNAYADENELFRNALDKIPSYVYMKDLRGNYIYANQHSLDLFNCKAGELHGKTDYDFFKKENAKKLQEIDNQVIERHTDSVEELAVATTSGEPRHYLEIKTPLVDKHTGKIIGICGISTDITQNKENEIELNNSKKMLRTILDTIPARVFWKDTSLKYLGCNIAFASDAKVENPDDLEGKSDFDMPWGDAANKFRTDDREVIESGVPKINFEELQVHADGTKHYLRTSKVPLTNSEGEIFGMLGTYENITELKLSEQELKSKTALLNIAGETALLGGWSVDLETNKVSWSDTVAKINGMPKGYAPDLDEAFGFFAPEWRAKLEQAFSKCVNTGTPYDEEMEVVSKDGKRIWVRTTGKAIRNEQGKIISIHGALQDISDKKKYEQELIAAKEHAEESDRLKSSFLANMSHEIRTPMNSIMGFASLLPDEHDSELIFQYAKLIVDNSEQLVHIIDDIVLYSRLQTRLLKNNPVKFNACDLIRDVKQSYSIPEYINRNTQLLVDLQAASKCILTADYDKVRQILSNLVSNAYKYTNTGSITIGLTEKHNKPVFFVSDTGIGIPENEVEKIFERFYRGSNVNKTSIGGTGLGLSIVKELIELLDGEIWVESNPEGKSGETGSTFWFTINA